jgi:hypothetical protein
MSFTASNLQFATTGTRTISCRIDRFANVLHDTYLVLTLPDIWSPLYYLGTSAPPAGYDSRSNCAWLRVPDGLTISATTSLTA